MVATKKVLYIDMDNVLVDFPSGIKRLSPDVQQRYKDNFDDAPGIFALMDPVPGAIDAYVTLAHVYDTYILSTAPWKNPSAWSDKVRWVQKHFGIEEGTPAWKRLILSHHKHLNKGAIIVDDRVHNGVDKFDGIHIRFASERFPDWPAVTSELLRLPQSGA
ncbi:hypothetical protein [Williamsia sp. CHRR-6]|uniref:5' nucleotidase, NT5C type n=1 Tax=Williamsia sp. CHRR-6 TaxID=2835871 RepID=UPI001BDA467D|nr:hypothetical protein [Williamsia sp. CHRR-6]MBT0566094.1 hypothetical protein [Williamsia sp. CHRR-6]